MQNMQKYKLKDELIINVSEFYKTLADSSRMKIIYALTVGELCVQDIAKVVEMSQTAVSYQLRILRQAHLVKYHREGKMIYYSIEDDHVEDIIRITLKHLEHE